MSLVFHPKQKIKYFGNNSFAFTLECKKEDSAVCALIAQASYSNLPIPVKCV